MILNILNNLFLILLYILLLLGAGFSYTDESKGRKNDYAMWNGMETIKEYADREKLEQTNILKLGDDINIEFVLIPAGQYIMGSPNDEEDRMDSEGPQHNVKIDRPFYMSRYEVTQEVYEVVMGYNPSRFKGKKYPVETVSWDDAKEFCKKIGEKTGRTIVLPSESEWEYACRAGSKTPFPPHSSIEPPTMLTEEQRRRALDLISKLSNDDYELREKATHELANMGYGIAKLLNDVKVTNAEEKSRITVILKIIRPKIDINIIAWSQHNSNGKTHPVGEKKPNIFGLYDMLGNVTEWVEDTWHENYHGGVPIDGRPWVTININKCRVLRGGSFPDEIICCRSAARTCIEPENLSSNIGFRIVMRSE
jgi:formylglycine-generating enzyme required for sulfatase activity